MGYMFLYSYILSLVNLITATTNNSITIFVPNFNPIKISLKNISKKIKENIEIILEQIEYGDFKECKICSNDLVKFVEAIKSNIKKRGGN